MAFTDIPEVGQQPPGDLRFSVTRREFTASLTPTDAKDNADDAWSYAKGKLSAPSTTVVVPDLGGLGAPRGNTLFLASGRMIAEQPADDARYYAAIKECTDWHPLFYSATCYLKLWWNLVVRKASSPDLTATTVLSSDAQDWEWSGAVIEDGCCCHANLDPYNPTTWNVSDYSDSVEAGDGPDGSDPLRPEDPEPTPAGAANELSFYLENIRWSFVEGYVPPADGSANGFPP